MSEELSMLIIILIILLFLPLFCDVIFRVSVRRQRRSMAYHKSLQMARRKHRPLIIFTSIDSGMIIPESQLFNEHPKSEPFTGDIYEIISKMKHRSAVILLVEILEYVDNPQQLWTTILNVTGSRAFSSNLETKSPKFWFDYRLKHSLHKTFYTKTDKFIISKPVTGSKKTVSEFYQKIFTVIPSEFFLNDSLKI
jgi:hypothetical protein